MNPDSLFELVSSLNRSEKRHFRLQVKGSAGSPPLYLQLFDLLLKMKYYQPEKLEEIFPDKIKLNSVKKHLYRKILRALQDYHAESSRELEIKNLLCQGEILFKRRLYQQAKKLIERSLKIASSFEVFPLWLESLRMHQRILSLFPPLSGERPSLLIAKQVLEVHSMQKQFLQLSRIEHELHSLRNGDPFVVKKSNQLKILAFKELPLLQKPPSSGFRGTISYWGIYALLNPVASERSLDARKMAVRTWQKHPQWMQEFPTGYILAINNLGVAAENLKKWDTMASAIRTLEQIKAPNADVERKRKEKWFLNSLSIAFGKKDISKIPQLLKDFEEWYEANRSALPASLFLWIAIHKILLFYFTNEGPLALRHCQEVLRDYSHSSLNDLISFIRIFEITLFFERGNFDSLGYRLSSLKRSHNKSDEESMFPPPLLDFFTKEEKRSQAQPAESKEALEALAKELDSEQWKSQLLTMQRFFDFGSWAKALSQNKEYPAVWMESPTNGALC